MSYRISFVAALCLSAMAAVSTAVAGGMASLTVRAYLDNCDMPAARVVDANGASPIELAGAWFGSGSCELLVDGVVVASSSGSQQTYSLPGADGTWRSYRVTLRSAEGETEKIITLYPSADFTCSLHRLTVRKTFLDSAPPGTVRKIAFGAPVPVAWSGLWSDGADRAVVRLYAGRGTDGTMLVEPVNSEGAAEGCIQLLSGTAPLASGLYTLTHFDGVETLTAYLGIRSGGTIFTLR